MSRKNSREAKRRRRTLNSLANTPPGYIDLVAYVKTRTHCSTGMAHKVLLAGALRVDSHPVGVKSYKDRKVLDPYLPAHLYSRLTVQMPKELKDAD